jgi:hypothetical protein
VPWFNVVAEFSSRRDWIAEEHYGYCALSGQSQCEFFLKLGFTVVIEKLNLEVSWFFS